MLNVNLSYSEIETRVLAILNKNEKVDVHRATAAEVFNVELDDVTDDQRRAAKAINFSLMYRPF